MLAIRVSLHLHAAVLLLPFVKGPLANPKIPHDVFSFAAALMLLYGLDNLALIESTCFHYPKNQKLSFSLFSNYGGNTEVLKNPKHPEYRETKVWVGSTFNPIKFSVIACNNELGELNKYMKEHEEGI